MEETNNVAKTNAPTSTPITVPLEVKEFERPEAKEKRVFKKTLTKKVALVYSYADPAGCLIAEKINEIGLPDWAVLCPFEKDIVFVNVERVKESNIVFLSRHQSEAGTKSLTVHMIGNYSEAKFGGKSRMLCGALSKIGANYLRALNEKNVSMGLTKEGFVVTMEVTHHGPYTDKNCVFIEIGSSPKDWKNELAAKIIAQTIIESTFKENNDRKVIGLGGGHYAPDFTKLILRQDFSFGHICPKHQLGELDLDLLWKMIRLSKADEIVLDWKGLKEHKERILKLCEITKLNVLRVQNLLK